MTTLCVKASFGSTLVRRVTFLQPPHTISIPDFRDKIARTFSLSTLPGAFRITYRDDDGDETEISSEHDLSEAINFFDDSDQLAVGSGTSSNGSGGDKGRVTIKVTLFIEYEGPSLSDRGSVRGASEGGSVSGWNGRGGRSSKWSGGGGESRRDEWDDGWDERSSASMGYDPRRASTEPAVGSYYSSSTSSSSASEYIDPPPPLPPRPPPVQPHSALDARHQTASPSLWRQPAAAHHDNRSSYSYNDPPGRPAQPHLHVGDPGYRSAPAAGDISDGSTRRNGGSPTSSRGSGVSSRTGRSPEVEGRSSPPAPRPPLSAPPTSASGSGSGSGPQEGGGGVRNELEERWFRSQEERLSHFASVKARQQASSAGGSGGRGGSDESSASSRAYSSSEESGAGEWAYQQHLSSHSNFDPPSSRPSPPSQSPSNPSPPSPASNTPLDLPAFLAELSLSRPRMPAPSVLSSVPDELLRCCGCGKDLVSFRYICALCGPILPAQALSDDGTQMERSGSAGSLRGRAGEMSMSTHLEGGEEEEEQPLITLVDDPLGVNAARQVALPTSPLSSPTELANSPTTPTGQQHIHDPSSSLCSPVLSLHTTLNGLTPPPPPLSFTSDPSPALLATPHELAHHMHGDSEDRGGFELCSDCIETEGVKHAREMAVLARGEEGESGSVEVRHSFCEVMKMGRGSMWQGWREVDYDDDVTCSTCGTEQLRANRFKCISCPKLELCLACYRSVEEIHPIHSFLAIPDRPAPPPSAQALARPNAPSLYSSDDSHPSSREHATSDEIRLAFLQARGTAGQALPPGVPPKPLKHEGVLCFGCLSDIVGPRYSCSYCPSFDLCSKCEALDPPITSPDGYHTPSHILLKINVPVSNDLIADATDRARAMSRDEGDSTSLDLPRRSGRRSSPHGRHRDRAERERRMPVEYERYYASHPGAYGAPPPPHFYPGPPPPHYFGHNGQGHPPLPWARGGPLPPLPPPPPPPFGAQPPPPLYNTSSAPAALANRTIVRAHPRAIESLHHVVHRGVKCCACRKEIQGIRWTCANCGSTPTVDLCSTCERSSASLHNPLHCFLRLTQPLQKPLPPLSQFLPVLYDPSSPPAEDGSGNGEAMVMHTQVVCDYCLEAIAGPWMRCCHCPESLDLCSPCLNAIHHDPSHVFVRLKRKVDLPLFRQIAQVSTSDPQPLLTFGIYS